MDRSVENRRPLKSRDSRWAKTAASSLAKAGVPPDMVSAGSVVFALAGAAAFIGSGSAQGAVRIVLLAMAVASIQLRLGCNLMDGLVAVEHGRGGPHGPIWNELPDRIADLLLLVGAGYGAALAGAAWAEPLGWLAGALAILTAYVRELGRSLGQPADFRGPGAKPQRMAALTVAAVLSVVEPALVQKGQVLTIGLALIVALAAITLARRTARLAGGLAAKADEP